MSYYYRLSILVASITSCLSASTMTECGTRYFPSLVTRPSLQNSSEDGERVFKAIDQLIANGAAVLPDGGRALSIPEGHRAAITQGFVQAYLQGAKNNPKDFIAGGNVGHMTDHLNLFKKHRKHLESQGIDVKSLLLAVVAHDTGKALLDETLNAYIVEKTKDQPGPMPFLLQRVGAHEYHSIANVPKIVGEALKKVGVDVDSQEGKRLVAQYSAEIIEAIRLHNGVGVRADLKSQYPSLTEEEIQSVQKAWWANFNEQYANATGSSLVKYGESSEAAVSPIGQVLNLFDRITLTTEKAPWKLGTQEANRFPFGPAWLDAVFVQSANGNDALVLAQGEKVIRSLRKAGDKPWAELSREDRRSKIENDALVKEGLALNANLRRLGTTLVGMNKPEKLKSRFNVPESELPVSESAKKSEMAGVPQYLYFVAESPGQQSYRVIAMDGQPPKLEKRVGDKWLSVAASPGQSEKTRRPTEFIESDFKTPTHLLMAVARANGAWWGTPP